MAQLKFLEGKYQGMGFDLPTSGEITIGRNSSNMIVITEEGVSGHHGVFHMDNGACLYVDENSTNGSFVNDEPVINLVELHRGDIIRLGAFPMRIEGEDVKIRTNTSIVEKPSTIKNVLKIPISKPIFILFAILLGFLFLWMPQNQTSLLLYVILLFVGVVIISLFIKPTKKSFPLVRIENANKLNPPLLATVGKSLLMRLPDGKSKALLATPIGKPLLLILFTILGYFTLALHIAPAYNKIFWKERLTLRYTIVTPSDVEFVINRFNKAGLIQQMKMVDDPFYMALEKAGIITNINKR